MLFQDQSQSSKLQAEHTVYSELDSSQQQAIHSIAWFAIVISLAYDVWGDTVNVTSRKESKGVPNHIQVTSTEVNEALDHFQSQERDNINVKGKGIMQTFLLKVEEARVH